MTFNINKNIKLEQKKILFIVLAILLIACPCFSAQRVNGYRRSNGTYVSPHYRSTPDYSKLNNYSTRGNVNPYTGKKGYTTPSYRVRTNNYRTKRYY